MYKIAKDHFKHYKYISNLEISPDGMPSFVLSQVDMEKNKYHSDLYVLQDGIPVQKTFFGEAGAYAWLEEEKILLKAALRKEDKQMIEKGIPLSVFHTIEGHDVTDGKEINDTDAEDAVPSWATEVFRLHEKVEKVQKIGEDQYLLLCSDDPREKEIRQNSGDDWEKFLAKKEEEDEYMIIDEVPFWTNSQGFCNKIRSRLYLYSKEVLVPLTGETFHVLDVRTYKGQYALYYGQDFADVLPSESKLYLLNLRTFRSQEIDPEEGYIYSHAMPIDDRQILVCRNDRKRHGEYQDETIERIDLLTGKTDRINEECTYHLFNDIVSDVCYGDNFIIDFHADDTGVYFLSTVGDSSNIFYGDFSTGKIKQVTKEKGQVMDFKVHGDHIYMIAMRGLAGGEIYEVDIQTGKEVALTQINEPINQRFIFSTLTEVSFVNSAGIEIHGWALPPTNHRHKRKGKFPTILHIHGGPNTAYGTVMIHEMQYLASEGYGCIFCNPRGSIGRGGDFADIRLKYGTIDEQDLMEFVTVACWKHDWIDADRLGVTGGSYGGLMTNWMIGHTDRFKAAVSDRSVANNICDFFLSDIGFSCVKDTYGVTPWEDVQLLWQSSPLKYAEEVKTPTLFIHGEDDFRCNKEQAMQMFAALKYFGVPARIWIGKNETHDLCREGSPRNRVRRLEEIKNWFDQYLQ